MIAAAKSLQEIGGVSGVMVQSDLLRSESDEVRASGLLGRSVRLQRLFDYLVRCSLEERSPKETEIASAVFDRSTDFNNGQDAVVRVYVHNLRRKLQSIYDGPRGDAAIQLTIPLGQYRVIAEERAETIAPSIRDPGRGRGRGRLKSRIAWAGAALVLVVASSAATLWTTQALRPPGDRQIARLRDGPVWRPLLANGLPTLLVVGDYYILGESDDGMEINRLVREFNINSRSDLDEYVVLHPDRADKYVDLGLRYLPVGSAQVLGALAPVIAGEQSLRVVLASDLTPDLLKTNNIVYVGYLSGLGVLRNAVFAGSRFTLGASYDELVDTGTQKHYVSQGGGPSGGGAMYRDYGYVSTFKGPAGNRIVIIAGARDAALMQMAQTVAQGTGLAEPAKRAGDADAFEALYQVSGMSRLNVDGTLIVASPLKVAKIWDQNTPKGQFPAG